MEGGGGGDGGRGRGIVAMNDLPVGPPRTPPTPKKCSGVAFFLSFPWFHDIFIYSYIFPLKISNLCIIYNVLNESEGVLD